MGHGACALWFAPVSLGSHGDRIGASSSILLVSWVNKGRCDFPMIQGDYQNSRVQQTRCAWQLETELQRGTRPSMALRSKVTLIATVGRPFSYRFNVRRDDSIWRQRSERTRALVHCHLQLSKHGRNGNSSALCAPWQFAKQG